jgi:CO dehydrogenase maturation factor
MEHISRQTTRDVDWLFIITDPTHRGLSAAEHIVQLVQSLGTRIGRTGLVINRVLGELPAVLRERAEALGVPILGVVPQDPDIGLFDAEGRPLIDLEESSASYLAIGAVLDECLAGI